jgi:hypothetical protein
MSISWNAAEGGQARENGSRERIHGLKIVSSFVRIRL